MSIVVQYVDRQFILQEMIETGSPFDPAAPLSFTPYNAPITQSTRLSRAAVIALAATFTGSAPKTPAVWGTPYRDGADNAYVDAQLCEWICSAAPLVKEIIYGVYWDNGVTVVIDPFPTPVTVEFAGDIVRYLPTLAYGQ